MTSADFLRQVLLHGFCSCLLLAMSVRPPQIRALTFHLMSASFTPPVPNSYGALVCFATLPTGICLCMKFLFVRPDVCRQLPSDSTSRWTPLPWAMRFPLLGLARDLHPLANAHAERTKRGCVIEFDTPSSKLYITY